MEDVAEDSALSAVQLSSAAGLLRVHAESTLSPQDRAVPLLPQCTHRRHSGPICTARRRSRRSQHHTAPPLSAESIVLAGPVPGRPSPGQRWR